MRFHGRNIWSQRSHAHREYPPNRSVFYVSFVVNFLLASAYKTRMTQTNAKSTVTLEIDALSYGPYGIGRLDGKAMMVPHTAPGDTVEVRINESKERYAIGEATRVLAPSPLRQAPPCPYVGACGGCSWQHLRYDAQLESQATKRRRCPASHRQAARFRARADHSIGAGISATAGAFACNSVPRNELGFFGARFASVGGNRCSA